MSRATPWVGHGWQGAHSVRAAAGRGLPAPPFPPPSLTHYIFRHFSLDNPGLYAILVCVTIRHIAPEGAGRKTRVWGDKPCHAERGEPGGNRAVCLGDGCGSRGCRPGRVVFPAPFSRPSRNRSKVQFHLIPLNSTCFHLFPLNSTSGRGRGAPEAQSGKSALIVPHRAVLMSSQWAFPGPS